MLQRVTQVYKGLQEVTGGFRGLQGLQEVTDSYRWLQMVTRGLKSVIGWLITTT